MYGVEITENEYGKQIRWCKNDGLLSMILELKKRAVMSEKLGTDEKVCIYLEKGQLELEFYRPEMGKKFLKLEKGDRFYLPPGTEYRISVISVKCRMIFVKVSNCENGE